MTQNHSSSRLLNWKRKFLCLLYYILEVFSVKSRWVHRWYMKWLGEIFIEEFRLAKVTEQDRVLHIGCGALPTMSLLAAGEAHAKVVAIDKDLNAMQRAQQYVASQHLSNLIAVEHGEGTTYPVNSFDVIFIATNVTPIEEIFRHLKENAKPEAQIVCRDLGHGVIHLLENKEFSESFSIQRVLSHQKSSSLLIRKRR